MRIPMRIWQKLFAISELMVAVVFQVRIGSCNGRTNKQTLAKLFETIVND